MSEAATQNPKVYTIEDICAMYKLERTTVYRLTRSGKLPQPLRIGRIRRYPASEVDAAFEGMRGQAV